MNKPTIRINPPDLEAILARLERLEGLAKLQGDLMLFTVETPNLGALVAATSFEEVQAYYPNQHEINYVGRANSMYTSYRVIKLWAISNE
jgi:hypothetical protein